MRVVSDPSALTHGARDHLFRSRERVRPLQVRRHVALAGTIDSARRSGEQCLTPPLGSGWRNRYDRRSGGSLTLAREDIAYKTRDHRFRSRDEYAQGKYDVTSRWLAPSIRNGEPGRLLVNVGCGSGEYNATARALGLRVLACEPEAEAFALASRHAADGCDVVRCGLMDLGNHAGTADFVVMHDVLEHIEDDVAAVAALRDLLKPDAVAVISVPAYPWLFGHHDVQLGHFRRYTRRSLLALFRGDDFEIEASRYYGAALIPIALWFSRISRRPYPVARASEGVAQRVMRAICQSESRIAMPVGTSVLLRVRRRCR